MSEEARHMLMMVLLVLLLLLVMRRMHGDGDFGKYMEMRLQAE